MSAPPIVWTIAGTDPTSGAGIQSDLTTCYGLGVYGCSVITAIVAQNTRGVQRIELLDPDLVTAQLTALADDLPPAAIKIGMLGNLAIVKAVHAALRDLAAPIVLDPVLRSTSGAALLEESAVAFMKSNLLTRVQLLTPNRPETEVLTGLQLTDESTHIQAARRLLELGCAEVYLKGGHATGEIVRDYWTDGQTAHWLSLPRLDTRHTHGTGCTFSTAVAAAWAKGFAGVEAVRIARAYVQQGLRHPPGLGHGHGPVGHGNWPTDPADQPRIDSAPCP
jgi:hydroxymethylpyrimidine kinase/phosphomethylpyrimidine kinase